MRKTDSTRKMVLIAMLGAMGFVLMLIEFPVPMFPYLKIDISDLVVLISTFIFGPLTGALVSLVRVTLNFLLKGASILTLIGDVTAFFASLAMVYPVYFYIRKKKISLKNLIIGLILSIISLVIVMSILNYFIVTPAYVAIAGFKLNQSIGQYVLSVIIPFNLIKGAILAVIFGISLKTYIPWLKKSFTKFTMK